MAVGAPEAVGGVGVLAVLGFLFKELVPLLRDLRGRKGADSARTLMEQAAVNTRLMLDKLDGFEGSLEGAKKELIGKIDQLEVRVGDLEKVTGLRKVVSR